MLRSVAGAITCLCLCREAVAQQVNRLDCQGTLSGAPATISGDREFTPTSALGGRLCQIPGQRRGRPLGPTTTAVTRSSPIAVEG